MSFYFKILVMRLHYSLGYHLSSMSELSDSENENGVQNGRNPRKLNVKTAKWSLIPTVCFAPNVPIKCDTN